VAAPPRDAALIQIETQIHQAIRDAVNRNSRKPFSWGGLVGYQQLQAIAQALGLLKDSNPESRHLHYLAQRVEWVLARNRTVAEDLYAAHQGLVQIANCLGYPPKSNGSDPPRTSQQVAQEIEAYLQGFHPTGKLQRAQVSLYSALHKRWKLFAQELLYCYDIPGLPQDNLQIESLFSRLRRYQRRISGRKSTRELRDFGQAQVLFIAESEAALLEQIQHIPQPAYQVYRQRLAQAEGPRQFLHHLHHDSLETVKILVGQHTSRCEWLARNNPLASTRVERSLHNE
jgi:hypothetical protein